MTIKAAFDSTTLITCCQGLVEGRPVIEHVLAVCAVSVPAAVQSEVVTAGAGFPDAQLAASLIKSEQIPVYNVSLPTGNVLENYKLGLGEKETIALCLERTDEFDFLVTDDRLAYIVSRRCGISTCLFLDLVIHLVEQDIWKRNFAEKVVQSVQIRFSGGFVPHTLKILERGTRTCLT
jgi:predicted nucleic acid-binding protein